MIGDVAGGYAAMSLFDPGREILTVEYKINFLAPAARLRRRRNIPTAVQLHQDNHASADNRRSVCTGRPSPTHNRPKQRA